MKMIYEFLVSSIVEVKWVLIYNNSIKINKNKILIKKWEDGDLE